LAPLPILAAALGPNCSLGPLRRHNLTFGKLPLKKLSLRKLPSPPPPEKGFSGG